MLYAFPIYMVWGNTQKRGPRGNGSRTIHIPMKTSLFSLVFTLPHFVRGDGEEQVDGEAENDPCQAQGAAEKVGPYAHRDSEREGHDEQGDAFFRIHVLSF